MLLNVAVLVDVRSEKHIHTLEHFSDLYEVMIGVRQLWRVHSESLPRLFLEIEHNPVEFTGAWRIRARVEDYQAVGIVEGLHNLCVDLFFNSLPQELGGCGWTYRILDEVEPPAFVSEVASLDHGHNI